MQLRQWRNVETDESAAGRIAEECELPLPLSRVLVSRGLTDADAVRRFLNPKLSDVLDPFELPGMSAAVDRVEAALSSGEPITVFGDYDADGVTATALLTDVLRRMGGTVSAFLPKRVEEGYGFTSPALKRCLESHSPSLIVTVDCGVCSVETVTEAQALGIDVVVTDHHDISGPVSPAAAVVNPKLGRNEELKTLAGVGVAFKLCHALVKNRIADRPDPALDLRDYLDLVAVGTVADVVPLTGENRILVRHGLNRINTTPSLGLGVLSEVSGISGSIDSYHLGFVIGPRLNAAGRMGEAGDALELLLTTDRVRARAIALELDVVNRRRKRVEDEIVEEAISEIDKYFDPDSISGIVAGRSGWHIGTVGIVAARLCRHYRRPAVVIGFDEQGKGRGSCRTIDGLSLIDALGECSDLLVSFGGHEMAAGLVVEQDRIDEFRERFNRVCTERIRELDIRPVHEVDAWIGLGEADDRLLQGLERLSPVGMGNPTPLWGVRNVSPVGNPRIVGKDHLKMIVASGATQMESIGFRMADRELPDGSLDLLFQLKENIYNGRRSIQLHMKDFRSSETAR